MFVVSCSDVRLYTVLHRTIAGCQRVLPLLRVRHKSAMELGELLCASGLAWMVGWTKARSILAIATRVCRPSR